MGKTITLPNCEQWENENVNVFKLNKMDIAIVNAIKNHLSKCGYSENEIKSFVLNVRTKFKNIPLSIKYGENTIFHFNDIVILNDYPLFKHYELGDCVCIFMVRYYTPYIWEHKIFMVDCETNIKQYDNDEIFLSLYYDTEILSL